MDDETLPFADHRKPFTFRERNQASLFCESHVAVLFCSEMQYTCL